MSYSYYRSRNAPVEVDKEFEAEIEDISRRGDDIARIQVSSYLCQTLSKENM